MSNQNWNPRSYNSGACFVPVLGKPVINLLKPMPGEKILDLGCGDGTLTKELAKLGCEVTGVDSSPEMVEAARAKGVSAELIDGERLDFREEFDAVMSNAALHWMSDQYAVARGVWRALKPGGRFAAECGGEGCVRVIREGMKIALIKRNIDYKARNPFKYPKLGEFTSILENQGFSVGYIARINRPTQLPEGLKGWLEVFSEYHTRGFSEPEKEKFYAEVEDYCRPTLYNEKTGWWADYVRLRFLCFKEA